MEELGLEELSHGYKLVPWKNWDEWNFVRECIFSASPDAISAALRRISAWRSRGCLPVAVAVTASIIEIQQRDSFFRVGVADDGLNSEEMLSMAYCMAIMRLVNGFVEQSNKKARLSIADSAEAIGLSRLLIDIRHEGSHRNLPSLSLLRLASTKALNWLKSNYWEPQKHLLPDIHKEIKSRLRKMVLCIKLKQALPQSSPTTGRGAKQSELLCGRNRLFPHLVGKRWLSKSADPKKQMMKIVRSLIQLYSASPTKVVTVLLEEFIEKTSGFSGIGHLDDSQFDASPENFRSLTTTINDWKIVITKLSSRKPELLLMMLNAVLEKLETSQVGNSENGDLCMLPLHDWAGAQQTKHLSSLFLWLLKILKKNNQVKSAVDPKTFPLQCDAILKASLRELLRKCLQRIAHGSTLLLDSAEILLHMIGDNCLKKRVRKLLQLAPPNPEFELESSAQTEPWHILRQQQNYVNQAIKKLEILKRVRKNGRAGITPTSSNVATRRNLWTVAKSWKPCPIGMLPCSFSSSGVLPVLERVGGLVEVRGSVKKDQHFEENSGGIVGFKRDASFNIDTIEYPGGVKKMREMVNEELDDSGNFLPMEGRLFIDGFWKEVGAEELQAIQSAVRILV